VKRENLKREVPVLRSINLKDLAKVPNVRVMFKSHAGTKQLPAESNILRAILDNTNKQVATNVTAASSLGLLGGPALNNPLKGRRAAGHKALTATRLNISPAKLSSGIRI